jgi:hypothetical protein
MSPALTLASRLRRALDPRQYSAPDMPQEVPGQLGPGAIFDLTDAQGRIFRVRVTPYS